MVMIGSTPAEKLGSAQFVMYRDCFSVQGGSATAVPQESAAVAYAAGSSTSTHAPVSSFQL